MRTLEDVAADAELDTGISKRFILYMRRRWADQEEEHCLTGYADEWAARFKAGIEYGCSDVVGQQVLRSI